MYLVVLCLILVIIDLSFIFLVFSVILADPFGYIFVFSWFLYKDDTFEICLLCIVIFCFFVFAINKKERVVLALVCFLHRMVVIRIILFGIFGYV